MSDNKHLNFINTLSDSLTPVKVHWSAKKRVISWFLIHSLFICSMILLFRPIPFYTFSASLIFELFLFILSIASLSYLAFLTMVPGSVSKKNIKYMFFPFIVLIGSVIFRLIFPMEELAGGQGRDYCAIEILGYSILPMFHIFYLAKKGLFFESKVSFLSASMAALLIPASLMHIACGHSYLHILVFHIGALVLMSLLFTALFRRIYTIN